MSRCKFGPATLAVLVGVALVEGAETPPRPEDRGAPTRLAVRETPLTVATGMPPVQMLLPGFTVRELSIDLSNINNIEYASDGRLFAAGYDGRLHLLRDQDGDGLEESLTTFFDEKSADYPLGIAVRANAVYVTRRHHIGRHADTNGDGVPDAHDIAAEWKEPATSPEFADKRRVNGGFALAIDPEGNFLIGLGSLNTFAPYMVLDENGKKPKPYTTAAANLKTNYALDQPHGVVLKISPDGKKQEILATGVRYPISMQFNRNGDLFATDQEGATWSPNGNPFDELLCIQPKRHYGFPSRHPIHLPNVVDEPSVFDYAPQHQSTCGFRFNETPAGRWLGPKHWQGDAIVTGESRGNLYRTRLVKSESGYVAQNHLIARLGTLPVDVALSPTGDLMIAAHSGEPDWGSGPGGVGKLFKISWTDQSAPQPIAVWAESPTETRVVFDKSIRPENWPALATGARLEGGLYVAAGDRFHRLRPGYGVVKAQTNTPRYEYPILSAGVDVASRSIVIRSLPRSQKMNYALTLPSPRSAAGSTLESTRVPGIDLAFDLTGVEANWKSADGATQWSGWLPHPDLLVAEKLTAGSGEHAPLTELLTKPGTLTLSGQLDLWQMLQPAVQPGSKLDFDYPAETVTVAFASPNSMTLSTDSSASAEPATGSVVEIHATPKQDRWIPFSLAVATGGRDAAIAVSWRTADDARPRALPLRRVLLPWAKPAAASNTAHDRQVPEIAGGDWNQGRQLFFSDRVNCSKCHAVRGEGGKVGPDLSNLIHRDYASVVKDIRQPNAAINPDFLSYILALDDGRTLSGLLATPDPQTYSLTDHTGKPLSIPRSSVESIAPATVSVMPEKLLDSLADRDLKNLMSFLLTEKP